MEDQYKERETALTHNKVYIVSTVQYILAQSIAKKGKIMKNIVKGVVLHAPYL